MQALHVGLLGYKTENELALQMFLNWNIFDCSEFFGVLMLQG